MTTPMKQSVSKKLITKMVKINEDPLLIESKRKVQFMIEFRKFIDKVQEQCEEISLQQFH
jgi:hypothetical protein